MKWVNCSKTYTGGQGSVRVVESKKENDWRKEFINGYVEKNS